ncbi:PTS sugar transporter subunit IIA [Frondihabitans australicus]|uniref:PTS system N-acetylglucosamine-specific IIA component (Glc family) n=1 Tax=Frondihabitans australicus TaxID=386892 RepID=A0A495IIE7_9MICO|nr:PTS glucose transporter subunit IIA [Frondihabitans australicus]RKR75767.1 PTS system N-acetylglucosamine-specific IIA component (Glc family) [Frondihabitans australicus]
MTRVLTPFAGDVIALADVPDPVFAGQLVGAGVAVVPTAASASDAATVSAVAPIAGTIVKLHPHAYAMQGDDGTELLVHVGIDTVKLSGRGFELVADEGSQVEAGDVVVRFDPAVIVEAGYSPVCPVVILGSAPDSVAQDAVGSPIESGAALFEV